MMSRGTQTLGFQVFSIGLNFLGSNQSEPSDGYPMDFDWLDIQVYSGAVNGTRNYPRHELLVRPLVSDTGVQKVRMAGTRSDTAGGGILDLRVVKYLVKEE